MECKKMNSLATPSSSSVSTMVGTTANGPSQSGIHDKVASMPGTSSITLPDHCFHNPETVQTFLNAWSNVMVAKEQSKASMVASTCELLSARAKTKAQTDISKAQCAKDILTTRYTELARTKRTQEECATTREVRRLQRDETITKFQKSPWQNFTNACTLAFAASTVTKVARQRLVIPSRGLRFILFLVLCILASKNSFFRKFLHRFMFWKHARFARQKGCSVSLDGRKVSFEIDTEIRVVPPKHAKSPIALNFSGRRFQIGFTDGISYWMIEAPINGKIRILVNKDTESEERDCVSVGDPSLWGVLLDMEQKSIYLTIDRNVDRLCFSSEVITANVIYPVVRGCAGETVELVR